MAQPPPRLITKPEPDPELNPAEPKLDPLSEKRGLGEDDDYSVDIYDASRPSPPQRRRPGEELYAAKPHPPEESWWRKPATGPTRAEYMCSNQFMRSVGIAPSRHEWDLKFTPENPWPPPPVEKKPRVRKKIKPEGRQRRRRLIIS